LVRNIVGDVNVTFMFYFLRSLNSPILLFCNKLDNLSGVI
jgi:hypothetical protein